ncbi:MAG: helix-turn-helix transcriptional regulator [Aestuariibacter sp.]|nr:helix-turn-helix transcriptional regulator [Aestuariibacter sp.]
MMNYHDLAEQVGVQVLQIQRYESGASQPKLDTTRFSATG